MRKTVFRRLVRTLVLSLSMLIPLSLNAQRVTLELRNATVQEAVTTLQSQGNYTIVINSDDVDLGKRISVSAKDAPLSEVIAQIFAGQNLDFEISGNTVSVFRHKAASSGPVKGNLKGTVTDREGEPLIGAFIRVNGTSQHAQTDLDGGFSIEGISWPATLTVS